MTDVALKEYFERRLHDLDARWAQRFDDLDRRLAQQFSLGDTAIVKAERTMNDRLNSMNEFRDALKDQAARMATRVEVERVDQAVQDLQRAKANLDGRQAVLSGGVAAATAAVFWILSRVLH